jgi:hypothetical protein
MKPLCALATALFFFIGADAHAQDMVRSSGESDGAFAERVLQLSQDNHVHVMAAAWNGSPMLFVDYETFDKDPERPLVALQQQPSGSYRIIRVTVGEQEGGTPDIAAIGFANADRDPAQEVIVILSWPQQHYDVEGTLYEVRIFDDAKPGVDTLPLLKVSDHFGTVCDCNWRDGKSKRFRFKTIAAVKAELRKLGYR